MARAEQAAPDGDRRLASRWSSTTTRAPSRCASSTRASTSRDPETFGEYRLTYRTGDIVSPRVDATEPLSLELLDFCHAIRTGAEPRSSARIGVDVIQVVEAVDESLANGGMPITIEPVWELAA